MVASAMREVGHVSSTSLTFFAKSIGRWDVLPTAAKLKGEACMMQLWSAVRGCRWSLKALVLCLRNAGNPLLYICGAVRSIEDVGSKSEAMCLSIRQIHGAIESTILKRNRTAIRIPQSLNA
jgi:hypothetical protein